MYGTSIGDLKIVVPNGPDDKPINQSRYPTGEHFLTLEIVYPEKWSLRPEEVLFMFYQNLYFKFTWNEFESGRQFLTRAPIVQQRALHYVSRRS